MKITSILTASLFLSSSFLCLQAQDRPFSVEIRGGANFTKMHSDYEVDGKPGYRIDVVADRSLTSDIFLRSGLTFSAKNSDFGVGGFGDFNGDGYYDYFEFVAEVRARYLQLPLMLGYKHKFKNVSLNGVFGSYFSYGIAGNSHSLLALVSSSIPVDEQDLNSLTEGQISTLDVSEYDLKVFKDVYKRFDSGLAVSIGAEFKRFTLSAGYEFGLINIGRDGDNIKNRTLSVSLGCRIF
jgi:Outer membrane protein beta-barrel domain